MKLSKLVYSVVKNVMYLDDTSFTYVAFRNRDFDSDQDYVNSINNAMAPINEAIHRLSDRNKIKYQVLKLNPPTEAFVDISDISHLFKKIKSVFYIIDNKFVRVGYREYGNTALFLQTVLDKELHIEYIQDIPSFEREDIYDDDTDCDLSRYGISETMCSYIIEYAQGKLQEPIAPELANLHITRAEQYFDDLEEQQTGFSQEVVAKKYGISR